MRRKIIGINKTIDWYISNQLGILLFFVLSSLKRNNRGKNKIGIVIKRTYNS